MKIYNLGRGQGKTLRLIVLSEHYNMPILCTTEQSKNMILELAKKINAKIPEPLTIGNVVRDNYKINMKDYLIDELPAFTNGLLDTLTGGRLRHCIASTLTEGDE